MEEEILADKVAKSELAIEKIISYCADNNIDNNILQTELQIIHNAVTVEKKDKLVAKILSSHSNYTYKVYLENDEDNSAIFVKVALSYAPWNPDRSAVMSLDRQSNEKKMMETFRSKLANDQLFENDPPICQPYFMIDISPEARMLVCRFERNQSVWSNQFVEGVIDERLIPKVAKIVAAVNGTDLDAYKEEFPLDYNDGVKGTFRSIFEMLKGAFAQIITMDPTPQNQHFMDYAKNLGSENFNQMMDNLLELYDTPQVLLHGDYHIVNILVDDLLVSDDGSGDTTTSFSPNASVHVCDWDMSHVGTAGRDIGTLNPSVYVMKSLSLRSMTRF